MKCILSDYKDIFGIPGEGIHRMRVPYTNTALIDTVLTLLFAWVLTIVFKIPFVLSILGCFLFGILCHIIFCVPTQAVLFLHRS